MSEQHQFQADVHQLLHLMVHSLYSKPDIFLREIISNASDSLDKLHIRSLTEKPLSTHPHPKEIRLSVDESKGLLILEDSGVGLARDEIVENLATIARSGTKDFLKKLEKTDEKQKAHLIGQFGVGFYSVFMVAEEVTLQTKGAFSLEGWEWKPRLDGTYTLEPWDCDHHGTRILLKLKDDYKKFLQKGVLSQLVRSYSDYIQYPIFFVNGQEKEQLNEGLAIWRLKPDQVSDQQRQNLFHQLGGTGEFLHSEWFHLEGQVEFHALLFIPSSQPFDLFQSDQKYGPKLVTNGVVIQEHCSDLLPSFLRFFVGILETQDLNLNVSREILQQNATIAFIRKQLVKKVLQVLKKLSQDEKVYHQFVEQFGVILKEGLHTAPEYCKELMELVRYPSSHEDPWVSFADYVGRLSDGQKEIYCLSAPNRQAAEQSPHTERLKVEGKEILYWLDPVDDWVSVSLTQYEDYPIVLVHRDQNQTTQELSEEEKALCERMAKSLKDDVASVKVSEKLDESPCCLVVPEEGLSSHMELLFQSRNKDYRPFKKILEINLKHPLIQRLNQLDEDAFQEQSWFLFNSALLAEGLPLNEPGKFAKKLYRYFSESELS